MNRPIPHQTIKTASGETLVVLPMAEFEALRDAIEVAEASALSRAIARGEEEVLTEEETAALIHAPTPLAFWRKKRGMTQSELAKAAGISQGFTANLELGNRKGDPALFLKLSRALGVSMEMLVDE